MKRLKYYLLILCAGAFAACTDLDIPPKNIFNEQDIFGNVASCGNKTSQAETAADTDTVAVEEEIVEVDSVVADSAAADAAVVADSAAAEAPAAE